MPSDPAKVYAKKHKINDLLNELYSELTENKPEDPIEHAIKHLESKLAPKRTNQLSFNVTPAKKDELSPGNDILAKLFDKRNLLGDNKIAPNSDVSIENVSNPSDHISPFININIMVSFFIFVPENVKGIIKLKEKLSILKNKINRIILKQNKELTNEEILEKENIVFVDKREFGEEEKSQEPKMM